MNNQRMPDSPNQGQNAQHSILKITLACLGVLLLALILTGGLSYSALSRLMEETSTDRIEGISKRLGGAIENGLNLGKPLAQFFGLESLLENSLADAKDVSGITVVLPDGEMVAMRGAPMMQTKVLLQALNSGTPAVLEPGAAHLLQSGAAVKVSHDQILFATPLRDGDGVMQGALLIQMNRDASILEDLISENLRVLLIVTLLASAGLMATFKYILPASVLSGQSPGRFLAPLLALVLAQGGYGLYVVSTFKDAWLKDVQENVEGSSVDLARNLDRVLGYGFELKQLRNIEVPFSRLVRLSPVIASIELTDREGKVLNRANAKGALPVEASAKAGKSGLSITLPLGKDLPRPEAQGHLVFHLDEELIARGVRNRVLDALTVVVVTLVAAVEMLLLSSLLMNRVKTPAQHPDSAANLGRLVRPLLFGFLLVWALPMGFLPIYARSLPIENPFLPQSLLLALPVALEMAFGLLATLFAGRMADRQGWHVPTLLGLVIFALAMLWCASVDSLYSLMLARCAIGLGYGLTWMGIQGFIVTHSPGNAQGRNITDMIAGIFAGHLSGAAVGSMLMEQTGFRPVFVIGAIMATLPFIGIITLMRPYMRPAPRRTQPVAVATPAPSSHWRETLRLLGNRGFGCLLLGSIVPFSVVQVGLLSFALPLYLESAGVQASNIGRVLMIYGLCVTYAGPFMGHKVDHSSAPKKTWILSGSLLAGGSLLGLYAGEGMTGAVVAVTVLAIASCLLGASQSPYMLALPDVQKYGAASATSVLRAADKFGQMAGPLLVGTLFSILSMSTSLALTGLLCLAATLLFARFAPRNPVTGQ
jgi:predicted MFS family arabinose efflux permease